MTGVEAVAKLREEREQHPYTVWAAASMVLEVEHARLLREAIAAAKKLKEMEETVVGLQRDLSRLRETALAVVGDAARGALYRLFTASDDTAEGSQPE